MNQIQKTIAQVNPNSSLGDCAHINIELFNLRTAIHDGSFPVELSKERHHEVMNAIQLLKNLANEAIVNIENQIKEIETK